MGHKAIQVVINLKINNIILLEGNVSSWKIAAFRNVCSLSIFALCLSYESYLDFSWIIRKDLKHYNTDISFTFLAKKYVLDFLMLNLKAGISSKADPDPMSILE